MKDWTKKTGVALLALALAGMITTGCGKKEEGADGGTGTTQSTSGGTTGTTTSSAEIKIDGSSTVYPIMERMAELFNEKNPKARPTVGTSGTGGGFKKFVVGEIDIANASRAIEAEEEAKAKENGIEFVEIPVAFDGLSVVINPKNTFAETLTVAELKKIWEPDSKVKNWSDVRAGFPEKPIQLFGAGTDSGTFDYFTKAINGEEKASRADYQASEDDNTLVQGVAGDEFALGYFGYAYYEKNKDQLKVVKVDPGSGGVAPSPETIADGTYQPLSRPLFIYINKKALDRPEVMEFVKFILTDGKNSLGEVGYVPLPDAAYAKVLERLEAKKTGSVFKGAEVGVKIEEILSRE
ncbi:MAG: PstS family phosphate ABC transporter substrate-binding protein [Fimbriimonadaceae bacterium]|nr:PstS family phosphate ABC transporter substrate-binding protein [Fimbriimonadaceae bacterium]